MVSGMAGQCLCKDVVRIGLENELRRQLILHRVEEDEVRPLPHPMKASNEPPFFRGQVARAREQASGLIPSQGASPLRDSAGFSPASLFTCRPGQTGARVQYRVRFPVAIIAATRRRAVVSLPGGAG